MAYTPRNKASDVIDFDAVALRVASPERIKEWSFGEVTKPETINYRTQRSEKNGLFDEKIFGPDKDYECYCGKYRGIRYKGIVCEKCGVEITRSIVRRERMGHIELASPVSHIWFLRSMPSRLGLILGMTTADLEKVIYFAGYIVTSVNEAARAEIMRDLESEYKAKVKGATDEKTKEALKSMYTAAKKEIDGIQEGTVLDEIEYGKYSMKYSTLFEAGIGAEAIYNICKAIDLKKLEARVAADLQKANSLEKDKMNRRLSVIRSMIKSQIRPEWMFLTRIPVIPPALRPMVPLDGGRYATSDVNDLYRRVINRNNRLMKLKEIMAPDVILRNEKRILQEAVDALIDNSIRHGNSTTAAGSLASKRALKSLADNLKGKRGLLRGNLLGKRVDYSGRSVIVVGPELALDQCGLPKHMALELFKPFVIHELLRRELAYNIRGASRLIEDGIPEVWAILEEVIDGKYVLLNRAPTLHRLGIQAFRPILIEGNAIQVHPLVCSAFNADFDGDQMAVHVPLSPEAQKEAKEIMASDKNILKPGSGDPTLTNKMLDIILGVYWMTKLVKEDGVNEKGEGKIFESPNAAVLASDFGQVSKRVAIKVLAPDPAKNPKYAEYKGGVFETTIGRILFNEVLPEGYPFINKEMDRKAMSAVMDDLLVKYGVDQVPAILDRIKKFGFKYTTYSGITWGLDDVRTPKGKDAVIAKAKQESDMVTEQFNDGLLSDDERLRKNVEIWHKAKSDVEKLVPEGLEMNVLDMVKSGARGSIGHITQMAGMKGLITNTAGETIEFPIISGMKDGLTPIEYFITTHGARKGLTDTALNTARAGYLTRRLFDVAQDVMVTEEDCGTKDSIVIRKESASGIEVSIAKNIRGRVLAADIAGADGKVLFKKGHLLSKQDANLIEGSGATEIRVRSPLACKTLHGVCQQCYGIDLGKNHLIDIGEAVGTVAAQAIGEPGTQLTMRTFHAGGTASVGGDITAGLPRVEEVFEKRRPKNPAVIATVSGTVSSVKDLGKEKVIAVIPDLEDKGKAKKGAAEIEYTFSSRRMALVKMGDKVTKGQFLTDGSADIDEVFELAGKEQAMDYIIREIGKIYELQGETVSRKHIEIIVKQMFSRRRIVDAGETRFSIDDVTDAYDLEIENSRVKAEGKAPAVGESAVMGITEVSLSRQSFLSAASFQHTTRIFISAAIRGTEDKLTGLKENVIIGRLIPAGTGYAGSKKKAMIDEVTASLKDSAGSEL
ncbi:MAG TPA: DNA-directed RNA polymerase subunit beta' [Candidatus Paceibacterota bacterium]|nr:DNA-directed RNA polymerase subunit beta' [Candidatus Paceibacterota bacterium]